MARKDGWPERLSSQSNPGDWDPWILWVALIGGVLLGISAMRTFSRPPSEVEGPSAQAQGRPPVAPPAAHELRAWLSEKGCFGPAWTSPTSGTVGSCYGRQAGSVLL